MGRLRLVAVRYSAGPPAVVVFMFTAKLLFNALNFHQGPGMVSLRPAASAVAVENTGPVQLSLPVLKPPA